MRGVDNEETDRDGNVNWGDCMRVFDNEESDSKGNAKRGDCILR